MAETECPVSAKKGLDEDRAPDALRLIRNQALIAPMFASG
jgi:hypothetical protein